MYHDFSSNLLFFLFVSGYLSVICTNSFNLKMLGKLPTNDALAKMRAALAAGDAKSLFSSSHNLKGLYASLGLTPLHALCSEIVEIARPGGTDGAAERLERLEKIHGDVLRIINEGEA